MSANYPAPERTGPPQPDPATIKFETPPDFAALLAARREGRSEAEAIAAAIAARRAAERAPGQAAR